MKFKFPRIIKETDREKMMRKYIEDENRTRRMLKGGSLGGKTKVWEYIEELQPKTTQLMGGKKKKVKAKSKSVKKPKKKSKK